MSVNELTETKQKPGEPVLNFISRWINLSLYCPQEFVEKQLVGICANNMHYHILKNFLAVPPETFEEFSSKAHNIEHSYNLHERADKKKNPKKDSSVNTTEVGPSKQAKDKKPQEKTKPKEGDTNKVTLKQRKDKKYSFPYEDVIEILDDLLVKELIDLPEPRRPDEVGRTSDPKYCKYHRMLGHKTQDCWVLKDQIQGLVDDNTITLDLTPKSGKEKATNFTSIQFGSLPPVDLVTYGQIPVLEKAEGCDLPSLSELLSFYDGSLNSSATEDSVDEEGLSSVAKKTKKKMEVCHRALLAEAQLIPLRKKNQRRRRRNRRNRRANSGIVIEEITALTTCNVAGVYASSTEIGFGFRILCGYPCRRRRSFP